MRFTSPSRRALGLMAVSTIGMSTAVLGVTGVASADPLPVLTAGQTLTSPTVDGFAVGPGVCAVDWTLTGARGGASSDDISGDLGGRLAVTTDVEQDDAFEMLVGSRGFGGTIAGGGAGGVSSGDYDGGRGEDVYGVDGTTVIGGGGGGGAATAVESGGYRYLVAFGGEGAGLDDDEGGFGGGGTENDYADYLDPSVDRRAVPGEAAGISATGVACVSGAPYLNFVAPGDGSAGIGFVAPQDTRGTTVTGYEASTDNGTTWSPVAVSTDEDGTVGTVTGLTNGQTYTVGIRAVGGTDGALKGDASTFQTVVPYKPLPAPVITGLTTTPSRVTISWTAPAGAVTGYDVGWSTGRMGDGGCAVTDPSVTTCSFVIPAGTDYTIGVRAIDADGRPGLYASQNGVTVPGPTVPAAVPTKDDGDITGPAGAISSLSAGRKATLQGSGYAPNSTVQLTVFSSPVSLGTVVTDQNGAFSVEVTIPANLANGTHHLVATGIAPDGTTRNLVITVTVSGGVATLATTGFDAVPVALGGGLFLLAGAGLVVGARRRSTNA